MKLFLLILCSFFCLNIYSQALLFEENFNYAVGDLYTNSSNSWIEYPNGTFNISVSDGNLAYLNYPASSIGRLISLNGGAAGRAGAGRSFTPQTGNGTTVYASFLLKITSTTDMDVSGNTGSYFASLQKNQSAIRRAHVYVRQGSSATKYSIGIDKTSSSSLGYHSTELDVDSTYLVVIAYIFQSGSDEVKLWINPDMSGPEPAADVQTTSGTDTDSLSYFEFFQNDLSGDMEVDGVRVSDSWSLAPLPVELINFSATQINENILLEWETATEINNYGFEIERSVWENLSSEFGPTESIAFVLGNGNSSTPNKYEYVDENPPIGNLRYRLKQIDFDGTFKYYGIVAEINSEVTSIGEKPNPTQFQLFQNYPNPFNPSTNIRFAIPTFNELDRTDVPVSLIVYDILGKEITVLVNERKSSGNYEVNFISGNIPSGVYFYQLRSNDFSQTGKMLLQK